MVLKLCVTVRFTASALTSLKRVYRTLSLHHPRDWYRSIVNWLLNPEVCSKSLWLVTRWGRCAKALRYREVNRKRTDLVEKQRSIDVWVNVSLVGEGIKGLRIVWYSVPCVLDTRDGIPLKDILNILSVYRGWRVSATRKERYWRY